MSAAVLKLKVRLARIFNFFDANSILIWAGLVGFSAAFTTMGFRACIVILQSAIAGHGGSLVEMAKGLPWQMRLIVPAAGGAIAGALLVLANRFSYRAASDYMEAIAIGDGRVPVRQTLLRSASSLVTIATGGSIGREGSN